MLSFLKDIKYSTICTLLDDLTGISRAQWAIDSLVAITYRNEIFAFQEDFDPIHSDVWYMMTNAIVKPACNSTGNALEFGKYGNYKGLPVSHLIPISSICMIFY